MSKSILSGETTTESFTNLLGLIPKQSTEAKIAKLGRTAAGLHSLREQSKSEGYAEGYEAGYSEGSERGRAEAYAHAKEQQREDVERFSQELSFVGKKLQAHFKEWLESSEIKLSELAVLIATAVLGRELSTEPAAIVDITKNALDGLIHSTKARIKVNPFDADILEANQAALLAASPTIEHIEIVADPKILGGCIIETEGGLTEATLETQLRRALDLIRGEA